eukprot:170524-Pyramimonas_sp.AAC.1
MCLLERGPLLQRADAINRLEKHGWRACGSNGVRLDSDQVSGGAMIMVDGFLETLRAQPGLVHD